MSRRQRAAIAWYGLNPEKYRLTNWTAETLYIRHRKTGKQLELRW